MKQLFLLVFLSSTFGVGLSSAQQWSGPTTAGVVYRNGNVLLSDGTTSAISGSYTSTTRVLQVRGNAASVMGMRTSTGSALLDMYLGSNYLTFNVVNGPIYLSTNYAPRITILTNGNVGIGTQTPGTFKLAVEGKLGAREVQVTTTNPWPDYVFSTAYRLRPLKEVESFILANKHLPEVPSADDIANDGHKLGEMDVVLLKKIEELTLYIIELEKKVDSLQAAHPTESKE